MNNSNDSSLLLSPSLNSKSSTSSSSSKPSLFSASSNDNNILLGNNIHPDEKVKQAKFKLDEIAKSLAKRDLKRIESLQRSREILKKEKINSKNRNTTIPKDPDESMNNSKIILKSDNSLSSIKNKSKSISFTKFKKKTERNYLSAKNNLDKISRKIAIRDLKKLKKEKKNTSPKRIIKNNKSNKKKKKKLNKECKIISKKKHFYLKCSQQNAKKLYFEKSNIFYKSKKKKISLKNIKYKISPNTKKKIIKFLSSNKNKTKLKNKIKKQNKKTKKQNKKTKRHNKKTSNKKKVKNKSSLNSISHYLKHYDDIMKKYNLILINSNNDLFRTISSENLKTIFQVRDETPNINKKEFLENLGGIISRNNWKIYSIKDKKILHFDQEFKPLFDKN